MFKKYRIELIVTSLCILLPMLAGILLWDRLPDSMATSFGMHNQVNGYSGRMFAVFGLPLVLLAAHWICALAVMADPRRQNISAKIFRLVLWIVPVVSVVVGGVIYAYNLGQSVNTASICGMLVGGIFLLVGNFLPDIRQNYTVGLRLPWTLANEENWSRTHRLAGRLWVISGAVMMISCVFFSRYAVWLMGAAVAAATCIPAGYSFFLHLKKGL